MIWLNCAKNDLSILSNFGMSGAGNIKLFTTSCRTGFTLPCSTFPASDMTVFRIHSHH